MIDLTILDRLMPEGGTADMSFQGLGAMTEFLSTILGDDHPAILGMRSELLRATADNIELHSLAHADFLTRYGDHLAAAIDVFDEPGSRSNMLRNMFRKTQQIIDRTPGVFCGQLLKDAEYIIRLAQGEDVKADQAAVIIRFWVCLHFAITKAEIHTPEFTAPNPPVKIDGFPLFLDSFLLFKSTNVIIGMHHAGMLAVPLSDDVLDQFVHFHISLDKTLTTVALDECLNRPGNPS